jgi:hypothetical protein
MSRGVLDWVEAEWQAASKSVSLATGYWLLKRASACPEDERRPVVPPLFSRAMRPSRRCSGRTRGQGPGDSRATFGCWCRGEVTAAAPPSLDGPELPTPPGRRRACHRLVLVYERHPGRSSGCSSRRRAEWPRAFIHGHVLIRLSPILDQPTRRPVWPALALSPCRLGWLTP